MQPSADNNQEACQDLVKTIAGLATEVLQTLGGYGFYSENELKAALAYELQAQGLPYLMELGVPILYKGQHLKRGVIDFIVFDKNQTVGVLIEVKQGNADGSSFHQAFEYFQAISQDHFPAFIKEKIRGILVFTWENDRQKLFKDLDNIKKDDQPILLRSTADAEGRYLEQFQNSPLPFFFLEITNGGALLTPSEPAKGRRPSTKDGD